MDIETPLFHLLSTCFPPLDSGISLRHVTRDNRIVSVIRYPTGSSSPLTKIGLSKKRSALRRLLGLYRQTQMGSFRKWVSWNGVYQYTNIYHPKWTKMFFLGLKLRRKEDQAWEFAIFCRCPVRHSELQHPVPILRCHMSRDSGRHS